MAVRTFVIDFFEFVLVLGKGGSRSELFSSMMRRSERFVMLGISLCRASPLASRLPQHQG